MKKNFKKSLSVLLALLMTVSVFSVCAFAAGPYTISFDAGTAEGVTGTAPADIETDANGSFKLPAAGTFERFGYKQTGWTTTSKAGTSGSKVFGSTQKVSKDTIYYPYWTANKSTVTYLPGANGTGTKKTDTATYNNSYTFLGSTTFTRTGYKLIGWSLTDGGDVVYPCAGKSKTISEDVTLYPYWVPANANVYVISFGPGSNKSVNEDATYTRVTEDGGKIKLTDLPFGYTRDDGYVQDGWSTGISGTSAKVSVDADGYYTATKNVDLYPFWKLLEYTVTYAPGDFATGTPGTETVGHGKTFKVNNALFEREDYIQTGWSLTPDGAELKYEFGDTSEKITSDITLYPYWTKVVVSAEVSSQLLKFGYTCVDYSDVSPLDVTIKNTGNWKIKYTLPTSSYYDVSVKSGSLTLEPDESVTLSIQPKVGLGENIYSEKLVINCDFSKATVEVTATFGVSEHTFVKYVSDGDATYKADGHKTATCANGCGKTDTIIDLGSMKVFSADNNDAQGLVPEYNHHRTIRFTAYGSGYDNDEPETGSKRFVPVSWFVNDDYNGEFVDGVFDVVYTHTVFGDYTLVINFVEEEYNEDTDTWTATGETDTKTFTYSVGPTAEEEQEIVLPNTILSIIFGLFAKILEMIGIGK